MAHDGIGNSWISIEVMISSLHRSSKLTFHHPPEEKKNGILLRQTPGKCRFNTPNSSEF